MCLPCIAYTINEWLLIPNVLVVRLLWRQFIMRWWDVSYQWKFGPHLALIGMWVTNDFQDQTLQFVLQNSMEKCKLLVTICWALWHASNKRLHQRKKETTQGISVFTPSYIAESVRAEGCLPENRSWYPVRREPSVEGMVKVNCDVGFGATTSTSTSAVIGRERNGLILGTCMHVFIQIDPFTI